MLKKNQIFLPLDKTLRNGLSMSEMDPLNHIWLDFAI